MKKFLALTLAMLMALSLVACGGGTEEAPKEEEKAPVEEQAPEKEEAPVEAKIMKIAGTMSQAETDGE